MFNIEKINARQRIFRELARERFGSDTPDMGAECPRCGDRYGNHYTPGFAIYCPDEWVAAGHELSL